VADTSDRSKDLGYSEFIVGKQGLLHWDRRLKCWVWTWGGAALARRTQWLLVGVAVLFGLIASLLVTSSLKRLNQAHLQPTVSVVVVTQRLRGHQLIDAHDVAVKQFPKNAVPPEALATVDQVVGRFTAGDWFVGDPVLSGMVIAKVSTAGFPLSIPRGERAFTIPDDPVVGVDHLVSAGDHVDVLVTYTPAKHKGTPEVDTVLQSVLVLYVDNTPQPSTSATASSSSTGSGVTGGSTASRTPTADTITLALTPDQAQVLDYARTYGQIQLVLRNPADTNSESLTPTTNLP